MDARGWTEEEIRELVKNTQPTGTAVDKRSPIKSDDGTRRNGSALVYGDEQGHVVVNDSTGEVVHISDKNDPGWQVDSRIQWN